MSDSKNWNIKIQLGNWVGYVWVPKARFPEAKAAHQAVLDTAWNWVEREDELEDDPSDLDPCVECGKSTAPGSGRWVNRLPFDDGYKCIECLGSVFDCDRCGEPIPFDEDTTVIDQEQGSRHEIRVGVDCCYKDTDHAPRWPHPDC